MAITYNIKEDVRYQQGKEEGEIERATRTVLNMIRLNFPIEQIMEAAEVSKEFIQKVAKQIKK